MGPYAAHFHYVAGGACRSLTPTPRPAWNGRLLGMDDCLEWTTAWNAWNALIRRVKIAAPCQRLNQSCLHTSGKLPTNGRLAACAGQTRMHSSNRGLGHVMERSNIEGCWERGRVFKLDRYPRLGPRRGWAHGMNIVKPLLQSVWWTRTGGIGCLYARNEGCDEKQSRELRDKY